MRARPEQGRATTLVLAALAMLAASCAPRPGTGINAAGPENPPVTLTDTRVAMHITRAGT